MASTRIREAREADCGDILRMIRVKTGLENGVPWDWEQRGGRGELERGPVPLDAALRVAGSPSYPNVLLVLRL